MATVDEHLQQPHVSYDSHVRNVRIALGAQLSDRRPVYLDIKFWILLRDAAGGKGSPATQRLLLLLRRGVADGVCFCPISETTFFELLKQSNPITRRATAKLIDDLSCGATLIRQQERIAIEISHLFHDKSGQGPLHPVEHMVWTRLSFVLGHHYPVTPAFDEITQVAIQKAFLDHMWFCPLVDLIDMIGVEEGAAPQLQQLAIDMNTENALHAGELVSFRGAYAIEARGLTDLVGGMALDVNDLIARRAGIAIPARGSETIGIENQYKNLIAAALTEGPGRRPLGTMHVMATLHAAMRWNKGRKVEANDFPDFEHAAAALVYCDAFFTERSLAALITQSHVALDRFFDCFTASKPEEALVWLESQGLKA